MEAALPVAAWKTVSFKKLTKYLEIFQCSVPTYLLLLDLNVCTLHSVYFLIQLTISHYH